MSYHLLTTLTILALYLTPCFIMAQGLTVSVADTDGVPVPYATVLAPSLEKGLITDELGTFDLIWDNAPENTTVVISAVGYQTLRLSYRELRQFAVAVKVIKMPRIVYTLAEVEVTNKRLLKKRLGLPGVLNATYLQSTRSTPMIFESGPIIRPGKRCRLDSVELTVKEMDADTVLLDINVYSLKGLEVGEQLLRERSFVSLTKEEVGRNILVDLTAQNLWIEGDFLVTFRLLDVIGEEGSFSFKAKTGSRHGFIRKENGQWQRFYLTPALYAVVSYEQ